MNKLKNLYGQLTNSGHYDENGVYVDNSLTPDQARMTSAKLGVPVQCQGKLYLYGGDIEKQMDMVYGK